MKAKVPPEAEDGNPASSGSWISWVGWIIALVCVAGAVYLAWQKWGGAELAVPNDAQPVAQKGSASTPAPTTAAGSVSMPAFQHAIKVDAVYRKGNLKTIIPNRSRQEVEIYTVEKGDSVFGIASFYNIEPETVLWSNYDTLKDNPHAITEGMELNIPPVNGVYYQWQEGDTFEKVAA
jgi:hypothetical protein